MRCRYLPGAFLALALGCSARESDWHRLTTKEAVLVTNGSPQRAQSLLTHWSAVREAFPARVAAAEADRLPVRIVVFRTRAEMHRYIDRPVDGFFLPGPGYALIALHWEVQEPRRVLLHEYVHALLAQAPRRLPLWIEEGLAEFYSTLCVSGPRSAEVGGVIQAHAGLLNSVPAGEGKGVHALLAGESPHDSKEGAAQFYALSWALVRHLQLAPGLREHWPGFVAKLADGNEWQQAFHSSFGLTLEQAFWTLVRRGAASVGTVSTPWEPVIGASPAVLERMPGLASQQMLADLALTTGRQELAGKLYSMIAKAHRGTAAGAEALCALALQKGDDEEALRQIDLAWQRGSRGSELSLTRALLRQKRMDQAGNSIASTTEQEQSVAAALESSPNHVRAHLLMARLLIARGEEERGITHLRRATVLQPQSFEPWYELATALRVLSPASAQTALVEAQRVAGSAAEKDRAEALSLAFSRAPEVPRKIPANVARPLSIVEGVLRRVDCLGSSARLLIEAGGRRTSLHLPATAVVQDVMSPGNQVSLSCGPHDSRRVRVQFDRRSDEALVTDGEVVKAELL